MSSGNFLAIDFETANQKRDSACSIGVVRVENGKIVHQAVHLIQPPYRDFMFTYIHGISWADVAHEAAFDQVWERISPLFKGVEFLAAHNATFDASVLKACCVRYGIAVPLLPFTCTVKLARSKWGIHPTKLPDVCRHLNLKLNHHEALSDALACAQIVIAAGTAGRGVAEQVAARAAGKPEQKEATTKAVQKVATTKARKTLVLKRSVKNQSPLHS